MEFTFFFSIGWREIFEQISFQQKTEASINFLQGEAVVPYGDKGRWMLW